MNAPSATMKRNPLGSAGLGTNETSVAGPAGGLKHAHAPQMGSEANQPFARSSGRAAGSAQARSCSPVFAITSSSVS